MILNTTQAPGFDHYWFSSGPAADILTQKLSEVNQRRSPSISSAEAERIGAESEQVLRDASYATLARRGVAVRDANADDVAEQLKRWERFEHYRRKKRARFPNYQRRVEKTLSPYYNICLNPNMERQSRANRWAEYTAYILETHRVPCSVAAARRDWVLQILRSYLPVVGEKLAVSHDFAASSSELSTTEIRNGEDKCELQLRDDPFFQQPAIACRGTTCYRTLDEKHVVKFSWRPDKPQSEVDHLIKAQGVRGVPRLVGTRTVTTIHELRSGLKIRKLRNLGIVVHEKSTGSTQLSFTSQSAQQLESLSVSGTKRKSGQRGGSPPKRSRSDSQRSHLGQEVRPHELEHRRTSTMPPPNSPQRNRILTCLAIAPAGRPLQDFTSVWDLLKAFRECIRAHRELFTDRPILHRDISHGNIILTDPDQADGCFGMLIDYDLAVQIGTDGQNATSDEKTMTGTLEFMAIEVLECAILKETAGVERTYRQDLESFFYVFLALCVRWGSKDGTQSKPDPLRKWYDAQYEDIAQTKRGAMGASGFEIHLLSKFSPVFGPVKDLARRLRDVLFGKGDLYTGTPIDPDTLYKPMIAAFETAIQALE